VKGLEPGVYQGWWVQQTVELTHLAYVRAEAKSKKGNHPNARAFWKPSEEHAWAEWHDHVRSGKVESLEP
jgi:hypothetical protein